MPLIRCDYKDCYFLDDGYCGAAAIQVGPDVGCRTFSRVDYDEDEEWEEIEEEENEIEEEEQEEDEETGEEADEWDVVDP